MKNFIICVGVVFVVLFSTHSDSKECDVALEKKDTYQQLNNILRCINAKVKSLEDSVSKPENALSSNIAGPSSFENDFIKIFYNRARRVKDSVEITFVFENLTNKSIELTGYTDHIFLTDEFGDRWGLKVELAFGFSKGTGSGQILPGSPVVTKFTFVREDSDDVKVFNFYADMSSRKHGKFRVSINNIHVNG